MIPDGTYRLRRSLELFVARDGDAYLLRGGSGQEHVIRTPDERELRLLRSLADGSVELVAGSAAMASVAPLVEAGAVVPASDPGRLAPGDAERFDRQLPYLEDLGDPVDMQLRLRDASVAIVGLGGLGTWTLAGLAAAGVGRLALIDDDEVEPSNLNRQVLYATADVGASKVERAAEWARRFDPSLRVEAHRWAVDGEAAMDAVADCDAWVLTADRPAYELARWVNRASLRHGVPFVGAGQQPPVVKVGPFHRPGADPCSACHERQLRSTFDIHDELARHRERHPPPSATLGAASGLVGTMLALEVMHLLLGAEPATAGRMRVVDIRTLESSWVTVERDPGCELCGESA